LNALLDFAIFETAKEKRRHFMITSKGIFKSFAGKTVLSGIDLDIKSGTVFGLLGPSGAGKTTLIKIITGQLGADSGEVHVFGKNVKDLTGDDKKQIGIMMDDHGVYDRLSVADNLKVFCDIYGIPYSGIGKALEEVGLADSAKKPAAKLSKGMLARLKLARVFLIEPKILFLDEPTSGLDPMTMKYIHRLIKARRDAGCTVFLTTHNMEEATVLCDEVALLNEGKIVERGQPSEICRRYNHKKTIRLHLKSGEDIELEHSGASASALEKLMEQGEIETIHSSEPTLETVFIELTGRRLDADEEAQYA
jgi:ABC-2 type transport system ATP-binding protein